MARDFFRQPNYNSQGSLRDVEAVNRQEPKVNKAKKGWKTKLFVASSDRAPGQRDFPPIVFFRSSLLPDRLSLSNLTLLLISKKKETPRGLHFSPPKAIYSESNPNIDRDKEDPLYKPPQISENPVPSPQAKIDRDPSGQDINTGPSTAKAYSSVKRFFFFDVLVGSLYWASCNLQWHMVKGLRELGHRNEI